MAELRITPQLPEYAQICQEAFLLLLDGKLRSEGEIMKFLAPFEPPPPPPPPAPVRRGRAAAKKAPPRPPRPLPRESFQPLFKLRGSRCGEQHRRGCQGHALKAKRTAQGNSAAAKKSAKAVPPSEISAPPKHLPVAIRKLAVAPARVVKMEKASANTPSRKAAPSLKPGKAVASSARAAEKKPVAKTLLKKAPEKKKHQDKKDKSGEKHSKHR